MAFHIVGEKWYEEGDNHTVVPPDNEPMSTWEGTKMALRMSLLILWPISVIVAVVLTVRMFI